MENVENKEGLCPKCKNVSITEDQAHCEVFDKDVTESVQTCDRFERSE